MLFSAKVDGKLVMRAYTPTSSDNDIGYFDLVIKIYFAGVNIQFPEGGKMSQHLGNMKVYLLHLSLIYLSDITIFQSAFHCRSFL
jgi:hypothetical protein